MFKNIKKSFYLNTVKSKVIMAFILFFITMTIIIKTVVTSSITNLETNLISDRLRADMNYIEDLISYDKDAKWNIKDNAIYLGDVLIGDGTDERANLSPFLEHEIKTKTLSYVFMIDDDAKLGYVESTDTKKGYEEGHYLRVAGSTKDSNGKSIVGTYISKNVSDVLDRNETYSGEANVSGRKIYCLYKPLINEDETIIGAVVVGRSIDELNSRINRSVQKILLSLSIILLICLLLIMLFINRWISSINSITEYLKLIREDEIPENYLKLKTNDEMSLISESINNLVKSLKENKVLRKVAETDELTGLPNRLAFNIYSKQMIKEYIENPRPIAVEILDVDYFKEFNDNYGHTKGDFCLKAISEKINETSTKYENIHAFRYGGDEFVIIYNYYPKENVEKIVEELRTSIHECKVKHGYSDVSDKVTITQGIYCEDDYNGDISSKKLLEKADKALYKAKRSGKDNYKIFTKKTFQI